MIDKATAFINSTNCHIYLTGKAGTGKTTFLRSLGERTHKRFIVVAPTGIAALNAGGTTIHSMFQLPLGTFLPDRTPAGNFSSDANVYTQYTLTRKHPISAAKKQVLRSIDLLIIDEVSMLRADVLDAMDYRMRSVKGNYSQSFGGVQVLMIGDMFQLPPIVKDHERNLLKRYYHQFFFFEAKALQPDGFAFIELDKVYRQSDQQFIQLLNHLRENQVTAEDIELLNHHVQPNADDVQHVITLTTHNYKADEMNRNRLQSISSETSFFEAIVDGDFPESMDPLPRIMELKVDAQVMFVRNDSNGGRYYNGSLATIIDMAEDQMKVRLHDSNLIVSVERETWENKKYMVSPETRDLDEEVIGTFQQFPIKLAWAVTVHKSQGLTFDRAIIDVGQAFAPGQVYVALSRLRSLDGLILKTRIDPSVIQNDHEVVAFSKTKHLSDQLARMLEERRIVYMEELIRDTFRFEMLIKELESVVKESDPSSEVLDETMRPILSRILSVLRTEDEHSKRYATQLKDLLLSANHTLLMERLEKGVEYYIDKFENIIGDLLLHMHQIRQRTGVKGYLAILDSVDQLLMKKYEDISRAKVVIEGLLNHAPFIDVGFIERQRVLLRERLMEQARAQVLDIVSKGEKKKTASKKKKSNTGLSKKVKVDRKDTVDHTIGLWREGKTLEEIGAERVLSVATIESHIVKAIESGRLPIESFVLPNELSAIEKAISAFGKDGLKAIYEGLNGQFSYGKIKAVSNQLRG